MSDPVLVNEYITVNEPVIIGIDQAGMTEFVRVRLQIDPSSQPSATRRLVEVKARGVHQRNWSSIAVSLKGENGEPYTRYVMLRLGKPANGALQIMASSLRSLDGFPVKMVSYQLLTVADMQILQV
jgi:hypothetical protein